jgi:diguanylate cyclase (GGDEF)-like protein/PAS domain S-box-containing protein
VHERDRAWFDNCKLLHFHAVPGRSYELVRALLLVLAAGVSSPWFAPLPPALAILLLAALDRIEHRRRAGRDPADVLAMWRQFVIARAVLCALLNGLALLLCPADRLVPMVLFIMATNAMDLFGQFTLPVTGLVSSWISILSMTVMLLLRPEVAAGPVLVLMILQIGSAHARIFNLHYLFATRRLRTRELKTANDMIELLLRQYSEHGSDCLVDTDVGGHIIEASDRLCLLLGVDAAEVAGCKLVSLFDAGPEREGLRSAARRLQPFHDLSLSRTASGDVRWLSFSGCPLFDGQGRHYGFRGFMRDVTDRHAAESEVRFLAHHDPLTQLANRVEFHARLEQHLGAGRREPVAALFADLDHFKLVNDSMGHAAGDRVLEVAAQRLAAHASPHDVVARLGGDEFALMLGNARSAEAAMVLAKRIVEDLSQPIEVEGRMIQMGASVGVALAPDHADNADELLRAADMALYEAKSAGRGIAALYRQEMKQVLMEKRALELELRSALTNGEFELHYQPFLQLSPDRIAGFEALLRWRHPVRGMIAPGAFISLAEQSGLIVPIGEWVLREALAEAATWEEDLTVAVNVSAVQMRGDDLLRQVVSALAATGIDPRRLELEITETVLMQDREACLVQLHRLRALGVRISLDDFGTGYSSLNYLRSFPFDKIKIDRCFIEGLCKGGESGTIVEAVLDLAARLTMQTIAEGVEEPAQLDALRRRGCSQVQGYLISKALPAAELPVRRAACKRITTAEELGRITYPSAQAETAKPLRQASAGR